MYSGVSFRFPVDPKLKKQKWTHFEKGKFYLTKIGLMSFMIVWVEAKVHHMGVWGGGGERQWYILCPPGTRGYCPQICMSGNMEIFESFRAQCAPKDVIFVWDVSQARVSLPTTSCITCSIVVLFMFIIIIYSRIALTFRSLLECKSKMWKNNFSLMV